MRLALREPLREDSLEVMNFLNEVVLRYPGAISFAPGRPSEKWFDVEDSLRQTGRFAQRRAELDGRSRESVWGELGQYGKTNGLIQELIARHLSRDEGIDVPPEAIIVTVGCQEAMLILMMGLFDPARDVLLVSDPTYIGITGLAHILGVELCPVASGEQGLEAKAVSAAIERVRSSGKRPRAVYDIPDFNNPLGTSMPLAERRQLLALARDQQLLIFEDNPYGMFAYDGAPLPTLKALEGEGREDGACERVVVYLGSFSKTLFPGLRLGYLVADQQVSAPGDGETRLLAEELSRIKSLTTVNTSPVIQAIAGGVLQDNGGSLGPVVARKRSFYKTLRDAMLGALERATRREGLAPHAVRWNRPQGGFFLAVTLPFEFGEDCLERCAADYGVICCPMSFFSLRPGREHQIRLSFSCVTEREIEEGVGRLARFIGDRVRR
jgi:(S)-3,5-dihydroxyphenylglycine transaminase